MLQALDKVTPGFTGMVPPDSPNPNFGPDPQLNAQLGTETPEGFNPVQIALDRRQEVADINKAVEQLQEQAAENGETLTRKQALTTLQRRWAQQSSTQVTPSSTSQPPELTQTSTLANSNSSTLPGPEVTPKSKTPASEATLPPASTPAPDSPAAPSIADIQAALSEKPKTEDLSSHTPEGPVLSVVGKLGPDDPFITDMLAEDASGLDEEFEAERVATLHPSTVPVMQHLDKRQCITMFRQSLAIVGLPAWSKWSPAQRKEVQEIYAGLARDSFEVDHVIRKLQAFPAQYGKQRLLRMCATILGIQAWMSLEVPNNG